MTAFKSIVLEYIGFRMTDKQVTTYKMLYKSYVVQPNSVKTLDYDNQIAFIITIESGLKVSSDNERVVFDTLNSVEERSHEHTGRIVITNQSSSTCIIEYIEVSIIN